MKLPDSPQVLPGGLVCRPKEIARGVWQAHLLKHPLGIGALIDHDGEAPWNLEGWDQLEPPAITQARRDEIVEALGGMGGQGSACRLPEIRGLIESDKDHLPCYGCAGNALDTCEMLLGTGEAPRVAQEYLRVTLELLASVDSVRGKVVARAEFCRKVTSLWRSPDKLVGLTVAHAGTLANGVAILWITRFDGVQSQYYFEGDDVRWKTTYREKRSAPVPQMNFLLDMKPPLARAGDLSDKCIVPRHWWENHED